MLWMTRPRFDVENKSVRRKILGDGGSLGERGMSGPRKITVGCVIFTVPRRNRVSHAVADETARARIETVIEMGSAIVRLINQIKPISTPQTFGSLPARSLATELRLVPALGAWHIPRSRETYPDMTEEELARELRRGLIQTASDIHPELGSCADQQSNALSDDQVIAVAIKKDPITLETAKSFIPFCNSRQEWFRFLSFGKRKD
jgi:hypothetical protein